MVHYKVYQIAKDISKILEIRDPPQPPIRNSVNSPIHPRYRFLLTFDRIEEESKSDSDSLQVCIGITNSQA